MYLRLSNKEKVPLMKRPRRSLVASVLVLGVLGVALWGSTIAGAAHSVGPTHSSSLPRQPKQASAHPFTQHATARQAQGQGNGPGAALLAKALFTGDLATYNTYARWTKGRQQDLDAGPEHKDTLVSGPSLAGSPTEGANGSTIFHVVATTKGKDGKFASWALDITMGGTPAKVLAIDAHRTEINNEPGE
jgi:hypothetical protein